MNAFLMLTGGDLSAITVGRIKDAIAKEGICHGLVPDTVIQDYIRQTRSGSKGRRL